MARPLGAVRLRKANPSCLALGGIIFVFTIFFLFFSPPSNPAPTAPAHYPTNLKSSKGPPVTRYNLNNVTITSDPIGNREAVLILTPMSRFYQEYWDNVLQLQYPRDLITLGFILPKTREGNAAAAELQKQVIQTQQGPQGERFAEVVILRQDFDPVLTSQDESERHKLEHQKERRSVMAKARNSLLFTTLGPSISWVLWLDADIIETPPTVIQDLALHNKPLIVPNCFQRFVNPDTGKPDERPYDFNNWRDSEAAQKLAAKMGKDEILLEGYAELATYRALMAYMPNGGDVHTEVAIDGVGGAALLVRADVHRDGAMFPAFPFYHLIETEGFAKMAKRLGWEATGLPNYKVSRRVSVSHLSLAPSNLTVVGVPLQRITDPVHRSGGPTHRSDSICSGDLFSSLLFLCSGSIAWSCHIRETNSTQLVHGGHSREVGGQNGGTGGFVRSRYKQTE